MATNGETNDSKTDSETPKKGVKRLQPESASNCSSMLTWDMDPVRKSFVYAELEVDDIAWNDDESSPSETFPLHNQDLDSKRKRLKPNEDGRKSKTSNPDSKKNLFRNAVSRQGKRKNNFNLLSDEIILQIFSYLNMINLSRCVRVCRNWKRLGYDESLWENINLTRKTLAYDGTLGAILHRGALSLRLSRTNIRGFVCSTSCNDGRTQTRKRSRIRRGCDLFALNHLDASMCHFRAHGLLVLLEKCRKLKSCSLQGIQLCTSDMRALAENSLLEELNLSMCSGIGSSGLRWLAKKCKRLRALNVAWTSLDTEELMMISTGFPHLEELNVSGMHDALTNEVVKTLMSSCSKLTNLDLSDSASITDDCIEAIVKHGKIKKLSLSRCYRVSADAVTVLSTMKSLEDLQIFDFIKQRTIKNVVKSCPNLRLNSEIFTKIAVPATNKTECNFTQQIKTVLKIN